MRRTTLLLSTEDVQIADVQCRAGRSAWSAPEPVARAAMIFVRRGCFRRRADGGDVVLDASVVYCQRPGAEQQIAHPTDGGGACTVIGLSDRLLDALWGRRSASCRDDPHNTRPRPAAPHAPLGLPQGR